MDWLDASHSARYQRDQATYCNVYAADFCYLAGAYLPRVWWTASALMRIAQGEMPPAIYDSTIREMRADDLHAWLIDSGRRSDGSACSTQPHSRRRPMAAVSESSARIAMPRENRATSVSSCRKRTTCAPAGMPAGRWSFPSKARLVP